MALAFPERPARNNRVKCQTLICSGRERERERERERREKGTLSSYNLCQVPWPGKLPIQAPLLTGGAVKPVHRCGA
jgi:hypothetical protein